MRPPLTVPEAVREHGAAPPDLASLADGSGAVRRPATADGVRRWPALDGAIGAAVVYAGALALFARPVARRGPRARARCRGLRHPRVGAVRARAALPEAHARPDASLRSGDRRALRGRWGGRPRDRPRAALRRRRHGLGRRRAPVGAEARRRDVRAPRGRAGLRSLLPSGVERPGVRGDPRPGRLHRRSPRTPADGRSARWRSASRSPC